MKSADPVRVLLGGLELNYTLSAKGISANKAFKVSDLSRQWGFSVETLKRHAKDEGCFAYIDTTGHDDFEECVMHPETAAARLKG